MADISLDAPEIVWPTHFENLEPVILATATNALITFLESAIDARHRLAEAYRIELALVQPLNNLESGLQWQLRLRLDATRWFHYLLEEQSVDAALRGAQNYVNVATEKMRNLPIITANRETVSVPLYCTHVANCLHDRRCYFVHSSTLQCAVEIDGISHLKCNRFVIDELRLSLSDKERIAVCHREPMRVVEIVPIEHCSNRQFATDEQAWRYLLAVHENIRQLVNTPNPVECFAFSFGKWYSKERSVDFVQEYHAGASLNFSLAALNEIDASHKLAPLRGRVGEPRHYLQEDIDALKKEINYYGYDALARRLKRIEAAMNLEN